MVKTKQIGIMSIGLVVACLSLSGCGSSGSSNNSSSSSASSNVSSSASSSSSDTWPTVHDTGSPRMSMTLGKSTVPAGSTFFEGTNPHVTYSATGQEDQDATNWSNKTKYSIYAITDTAKTNPIGAGQALSAGEYIAFARYESKNKEDFARFTVEDIAPTKASEGNGYKTTTADELSDYMVSKHDFLGALGKGKFPSVGKPKLIVVPVAFSNVSFKAVCDASTEDEANATCREVIRKAFFGEDGSTEWESLKSYYYKSSYGKLDIQGEVSPVYTYPMTTDAFETGYKDKSQSAATVVTAASNWLRDSQGYNLDEYDLDDDGYIDGIELVYVTDKKPASSGGSDSDTSSLWWNYTNYTGASKGTKANPSAYRYFWSLYTYIQTGYYKDPNIDAHTLVHETGHLMGLNDYYSYDKTEGPAGCVDMMDMNVGDHNAYSKMAYGWIGPKVVDGSSSNFEITLNSYTDTGDFILLRNTSDDKWNGTPWDEYLILEYYTPTGVNKVDSTGYPEWSEQVSSSGSASMGHGGTYEKSGLQVFHVDSRLAAKFGTVNDLGQVTNTTPKYTDDLLDSDKTQDGVYQSASYFPHDNTPSRSQNIDDASAEGNGPYREIHAIFSSGINGLESTTYYNSFGQMSNLFGMKDTVDDSGKSVYGGDTYSNWKMRSFFPNDLTFDDSSTLNWTFSVTAQTDSTITLHFVENA